MISIKTPLNVFKCRKAIIVRIRKFLLAVWLQKYMDIHIQLQKCDENGTCASDPRLMYCPAVLISVVCPNKTQHISEHVLYSMFGMFAGNARSSRRGGTRACS